MEKIELKINGLNLNVVKSDVINNGKIPLFMTTPGWGWSYETYYESLKYLFSDYLFYFIETRGTGCSEGPGDLSLYQFSDFSSDFDLVREELGLKKVNFVGHSYGGVLGMKYALEFPNSINKLIILSSFLGKDSMYRNAYDSVMKLKKEEPWFKDIKHFYEMEFVSDTQEKLESWVNGILPLYFSNQNALQSNRKLFNCSSINIEPFEGTLKCCPDWDANMYDEVKNLNAQTHIICGEEDFVCPLVENKRIYNAIENSSIKIIPKVGHFPWIEKPTEFKAALDNAFS